MLRLEEEEQEEKLAEEKDDDLVEQEAEIMTQRGYQKKVSGPLTSPFCFVRSINGSKFLYQYVMMVTNRYEIQIFKRCGIYI